MKLYIVDSISIVNHIGIRISLKTPIIILTFTNIINIIDINK